MKIAELYDKLSEIIPSSLSEPWDNDGLMICPDPDDEVRGVLLALDGTRAALDEAKRIDCNLLITHHPIIFEPLANMSLIGGKQRLVYDFLTSGVAVMSFHTRLDTISGGVSDVLAGLLGVQNTESFGADGGNYGRIGCLKAYVPTEQFVKTVKSALSAPAVSFTAVNSLSHKVAVAGGSAKELIARAAELGADTIVLGSAGYNDMVEAAERGISVIEAGHYDTEAPVLDFLAKTLADLNIKTEKYKSNPVITIV